MSWSKAGALIYLGFASLAAGVVLMVLLTVAMQALGLYVPRQVVYGFMLVTYTTFTGLSAVVLRKALL